MKKNVSIKVKNLVSAAFAAVMLFILLAGCQASSDPHKATDSAYGYGSSQTSTTQAAKPDGKDEGTVSAQKPDPSKPDGSKDSTKPDPAQPSTETSGKDESKPSAGNSGNTGSGSGNGSAEPSTGGTGNGSSGNGGSGSSSGGNSSKPTTGNSGSGSKPTTGNSGNQGGGSGSGSGNSSGNGSQPSTGGSGNQGSGSGSGNSGNGSSGSGSNPSTGGSGNQGGNSGSSGNQGGSSAPSTPAKPSEPPKQNDPAPSNPAPTNPAPSNPAPTNPPHTHSYKAVQTVKPTCNTKGYTVYKCSCGDSYQSDEVPATGHSWGDWVVTIEPTVEAEGRRTKTCSVCGMTESQDIPKLDPPPTTPSAPVSLNMRDVEAAVLKYINQFRNQQGAGSLSYRSDMTAYSQYRASQLIYNFAHDRNDQAAAADATKYGIYDKATGHYQFLGSEAICWTGINPDYTADYIGLRIATAWYESASHWNYVGDAMMVFAGVGCAQGSDGNVYACIIVFDEYLDEQLNLDYSSQP